MFYILEGYTLEMKLKNKLKDEKNNKSNKK